jgi:transposase-like protein
MTLLQFTNAAPHVMIWPIQNIEVLRVAKRGRKPILNASRIACPNPDCRDFGREGLHSVVLNGTYPTRSGKGQRFKCKTCGRSFCQRSGTVFDGLRSEEDRVVSAVKLLAKGISVRKAAQMLNVKPDTLRHWLSQMAENPEAANQKLIREPGMSEAELTTLWNFVKENALKQRAILWRKRCGWRQGWESIDSG